ncbi:hypothetical protein ACFOSD_12500 [Salinispirillum marinum]|uniref:Class IIb bacteriocin, lactobin A/cerein 7B family n=2 Tax=Saccharospirillaceae TaxID=255527 RepID=A0ABV8BFR7_9GAMM
MQTLNVQQVEQVNGGARAVGVFAVGYVVSKAVDAAVSYVKKDIEKSRRQIKEKRESQTPRQTRRGIRWR